MKIPLLGTGSTAFGELWSYSIPDLISEAQHAALQSAHLTADAIDLIIVANMGAELWSGQGHLGALAAETIKSSAPAFRIEAACASGGVALATGIMAIQSGMAKTVMITGVEKMTDHPAGIVNAGLMTACRNDVEYMAGASFASLFALVTRHYFDTYHIGRKELAAVSVKNHAAGYHNPKAHLRKKITIDEVLSAPMIADPLSILDCSPVSDGAASIIIGSPEHHQSPISIIGSGQGIDTMSITTRPTLTSFLATQKAAAQAFGMTSLTPQDIAVAEIHDAFSMAELIALEDLGFCQPGTAYQHVGTTNALINQSGGLKAKGHPIGATGIGQVIEIAHQLQICKQQKPNTPHYGLTHNMGGIGTTVAVHLFSIT